LGSRSSTNGQIIKDSSVKPCLTSQQVEGIFGVVGKGYHIPFQAVSMKKFGKTGMVSRSQDAQNLVLHHCALKRSKKCFFKSTRQSYENAGNHCDYLHFSNF
jgi:hypothetical protein